MAKAASDRFEPRFFRPGPVRFGVSTGPRTVTLGPFNGIIKMRTRLALGRIAHILNSRSQGQSGPFWHLDADSRLFQLHFSFSLRTSLEN